MNSTIFQAILLSSQEDRSVDVIARTKLEYQKFYDDLLVESEDSADHSERESDFWGEIDGSEWRVYLHGPLAR